MEQEEIKKEINLEELGNKATFFIRGVEAEHQKTEKVLRDTRNKYNSWLAEELQPKIGKTFNVKEINRLKSKVEVIREIQDKLGL